MAQQFIPKVATSNHLTEGDVIYFARPHWTRDLRQATVAQTPQEAEHLLAEAGGFALETVGAALMDVALQNGVPSPNHLREDLRTKGPSNYFHGKQAEHV